MDFVIRQHGLPRLFAGESARATLRRIMRAQVLEFTHQSLCALVVDDAGFTAHRAVSESCRLQQSLKLGGGREVTDMWKPIFEAIAQFVQCCGTESAEQEFAILAQTLSYAGKHLVEA